MIAHVQFYSKSNQRKAEEYLRVACARVAVSDALVQSVLGAFTKLVRDVNKTTLQAFLVQLWTALDHGAGTMPSTPPSGGSSQQHQSNSASPASTPKSKGTTATAMPSTPPNGGSSPTHQHQNQHQSKSASPASTPKSNAAPSPGMSPIRMILGSPPVK